MRFLRRNAGRDRHPASRTDLIALWGPDDEGADAAETAPGAPEASAEPATEPTTEPATGPTWPRPPTAPGAGRGRVGRVALLVAVIAAGLAVDHSIGGASVPAGRAAVARQPTMAPASALSSTWLCPALGASAASPVLGRLVLANPGAVPLTATVTIVPAAGAPVVQHPRVAPYSRATIALETVAPGDYAAATITFDGPGGAVEQQLQGALGTSSTPCATTSSDHWYFPTGETDAGADEYVSLYNPYPAPAIADLRFETDQGEAVPEAFQGVVVPASGFTVLNIGARVRSRAQVAAVVDIRGGRVVADEFQVLSSASHGLLLTLGAPALSTSWFYAYGGVGPGVRERFDVYNPGPREASVSAAPILDQGSAEPFDLSVPPQGVVSLEVDTQARIPPGVGQGWVLTSTNGVPVVTERVITSVAPATQAGVMATVGSETTARRWVFGAGSTTGGQQERLVVLNPGGVDAHISVVASGGGGAVRLPADVAPAGARASIDIGPLYPAADVMLDVTSDVPVVAERELYGNGQSLAVGVAGP